MEKRVIDITEDSSDYEPSPPPLRKVTLYNEKEEEDMTKIVKPDGKRNYEEIIIADSEGEEILRSNNSQKHKIPHIAHKAHSTHNAHNTVHVNSHKSRSRSPTRQIVSFSSETERLISIFLALASTEQQIRLAAFDKLKEFEFAKKQQVNFKGLVLSVIEGELINEAASNICKLAALNVLTGLDWVRKEIAPVCLLLLKLITGGSDHAVRCEALITLETVMLRTASLQFWKTKVNAEFHATKVDLDTRDNFDIITKLFDLDLFVSELIFAVLSYVGANDIYKQVRSLAIETIGKIPGTIRKAIFMQSLKKDFIKPKELSKYAAESEKPEESECEEGEIDVAVKDNTPNTINTPNTFKSTGLQLPLLCCGVFAHGIEDQFVQIRFKTLISLFNLSKSSDKLILNIFLDSLLDECDLIRLAALKFLRKLRGGLPLTVDEGGGLECLLAVLDDQNGEIRREALTIIGNDLSLLTSSRQAALNETLLRTQKCLEAALLKYPEMEFQVIQAAYKLVSRHTEIIRKSCTEFWSHLMQCPIPKFMTPSSLLPYGANNNFLSQVQAAMQIPFLPEGLKQSRLVRIVSRIQDCSIEEKLSLLHDSGIITESKSFIITKDNDKLFQLQVPLDNFSNLQCRYEADLLKNKNAVDSFYFFETATAARIPRAYFKIAEINIISRAEFDEVRIDEFKLIGSADYVHLDLVFEETTAAKNSRFRAKYGGTEFVAKCPKGLATFKIVNCNTRAVIYYHTPNKL